MSSIEVSRGTKRTRGDAISLDEDGEEDEKDVRPEKKQHALSSGEEERPDTLEEKEIRTEKERVSAMCRVDQYVYAKQREYKQRSASRETSLMASKQLANTKSAPTTELEWMENLDNSISWGIFSLPQLTWLCENTQSMDDLHSVVCGDPASSKHDDNHRGFCSTVVIDEISTSFTVSDDISDAITVTSLVGQLATFGILVRLVDGNSTMKWVKQGARLTEIEHHTGPCDEESLCHSSFYGPEANPADRQVFRITADIYEMVAKQIAKAMDALDKASTVSVEYKDPQEVIRGAERPVPGASPVRMPHSTDIRMDDGRIVKRPILAIIAAYTIHSTNFRHDAWYGGSLHRTWFHGEYRLCRKCVHHMLTMFPEPGMPRLPPLEDS